MIRTLRVDSDSRTRNGALTAVGVLGILILVAASVAILFEPSYRSAHCYPSIPGVGLRAACGLLLAFGAGATALAVARRSAASWLVLVLLVLAESRLLPLTFILGDPGIDLADESWAECGRTAVGVAADLAWMHLAVVLSIVAIAAGRPLRAFGRASWLAFAALAVAATGVYAAWFWPV